MNKKFIFAGLLFLATFFYGLVWAAIVPAGNEAPDEGAHAEMINFFKSEKRIPVFNQEPKLLTLTFDKSQLSGAYYSMAYLSPLNYLPFLLSFHSQQLRYEKADVLASRAINCFLLGLFAAFLFLALSEISAKNFERAALVTIFFALIPQVIFSAGHVNVEPIGLFISVLTFYFLIRTKNQPVWQNFLFLGISSGLLALCKTNYLILIIAFLPPAVYWLFKSRQKFLNFISLILPFFTIPSWWWIRNFKLYHDPLIMTYIERLIKEQAPSWFSPPVSQGYHLLSLLFEKNFVKFSYTGFFGVLGGANIFFPAIFYWFFYLILLAPIVYLVWSVIPAQAGIYRILAISGSPTKLGMTKKLDNNFFVIFWLVFVIIVYFFIFVAKNLQDFSPQGRHLFPLIIPLAWLFYLAVDKIKLRLLPIVATIFSIISSIYGLWLVVDSYYIRGYAYTMPSNTGKIAEGFSWGNLSLENYRNLINFIFLENTNFFSPILVIIYFLIFIISIIALLVISRRNDEKSRYY